MKQYTTKEVEKLLTEGKTLNLIDVREVEEVRSGKIPGAVNIPLGLLEYRLNELDKTKEYVIVCKSGGRSGRASLFLGNLGFKVINMAGGMLAWEGPRVNISHY